MELEKQINKALGIFKKELEKTYTDTCNVYIFEDIVDDGVVSGDREVLLYENIKCGLSFIERKTTTTQDNSAWVLQDIKLFLSNDYDIPINSIIVVEHKNREYRLKLSGKPSIYDIHQEITVRYEENA